MSKTLSTFVAVALLGGAMITVAQAQDRRRDRDNNEFGPASVQQLAAADRRLNQVYKLRIADARADHRAAHGAGSVRKPRCAAASAPGSRSATRNAAISRNRISAHASTRR